MPVGTYLDLNPGEREIVSVEMDLLEGKRGIELEEVLLLKTNAWGCDGQRGKLDRSGGILRDAFRCINSSERLHRCGEVIWNRLTHALDRNRCSANQ